MSWALVWQWVSPLVLSCGSAPGDVDAAMVRLDGPDGPFWIDRFEHPGEPGALPTARLDLPGAEAACAAQGKRLCAAAEWRWACAGAEGRVRPGPAVGPGACHVGERMAGGHSALTAVEEVVRPAGSAWRCVTPEGVWDLVGNVEEWVLDDWNGRRGSLEGGATYSWAGAATCDGAYSRAPDFRLDPTRTVFSAGARCCLSEGPPDVGRDARDRLQHGSAGAGSYRADDEVEVTTGLWMDRYEYPNRPGEPPRTGVTWDEAVAACAAAGKRLCTGAEWERACLAAEPWGWPGRCAVGVAGLEPSGGRRWCTAAGGVHDLVGNAWEWTSDRLDAAALGSEERRAVRGGAWNTDGRRARCVPEDGYPAAPAGGRWPEVGLRCCRGLASEARVEPLPATVRCTGDAVAVGPACVDRFEWPGVEGGVPRGGLTLGAAREACAQAGKHLCSADTWRLACAGGSGRAWPWGDAYVAGRCNDGATQAREGAGGVGPSGAWPDCASPEGVMDLSGNLWEWTDDGVARGGGWNLSAGLNRCSAVARVSADLAQEEVGARCCSEPAP